MTASASLALAFAAGLLAAFNPCGFALLPGYVSMFLSNRSGRAAWVRALQMGALVTVGFVITFGIAGLAVTAVSVVLGSWLSVVTMVMGAALMVVGLLSVVGKRIAVRVPQIPLTVSQSRWGMVSYGIIYATVSLSCTLPVFLAAVVTSFDATVGGPLLGTAGLVLYALGMGVVLTSVALTLAIFESGAQNWFRRVLPYLPTVSGIFLIIAGAYVLWYGWNETRILAGESGAAGVTSLVSAASHNVSNFLAGLPLWVFPLVVAVLLVAGIAAHSLRARTQAPSRTPVDLPDPVIGENRERISD